ncbi:4-hydroxy-tetrahydrodipicolinate reductase [Salinibaculum rarum]|uniref:4-hydroxy-tetrahydrodipicolinate reductase n=1 Tax=Salinibaculum rarum TaxID=3058903 RepID=UPI00265E2219|nr:4-hydroxy-tetrahydrodipicolinate reductase [Salinibaculum sp. KK48]
MTRLGVNGAAGRMGQTVIETASERDDVSVAFGIDVDSDADTEVPLYAPDETADALAEHEPDAIIDFTVPDSTVALAEACADAGVALVVGTTGIDEDQLSVLQEASEAVPLLKATNFSRGIQGLLRALGPALEALDGYDIEVMETHHNQKQDAPSGTAKTILEEVSEHRDFETVAGREGIQPREDGEVGMLVRRAGDIRGEHEVILADNDEVLSISHRAEDRAVFAAGAIDAAVWLTEQDAGWYGFDDVVDES